MSATYINPALPSMIRGLYRADLREKSIQNMLDLAADLIQELIELRAEHGTEEPEDPDAVFEYRVRNDVAGFLSEPMTLSGARDEAKIDPHDFIERRRKPNEWTPVEQEPDHTTNHEIGGQE